jgi:vitamin B12 transporter
MARRFVRMMTLAALSLAPSLAAAQQDTARKADSTRQHLVLAPIIVSASRDPMRQDRLGVATSVLTALDLAKEPARTAGDALARLPGVFMDATAGVGGPSNIRLRGGDEAFTKVLMDGVEVNFSGGPFEFQGVTANNIGRIEVVRGPQSALHGSSAMTGVVQLFTAPGQAGGPRWSVDAEGGGAAAYGDHGRATFAVGGGSNTVQYSVGLGGTYDRGIYEVPHRALTRDASARVDVTPSGPLTLTSAVRYYDISSHLPVRDPGATRAPLDSNQRDAHEILTTSVTATLAASPTWSHQFRVALLHDAFTYNDLIDSIPDNTKLFADGASTFNQDFYLNMDMVRWTVAYDGVHRFGNPEDGAWWSYGGAFEREITGDTIGGDFGNAFTPGHRNHGSIFSEATARVSERLSLLAGGRVETYNGLGWTVVPRASAVFVLAPGQLSLRSAVGRAFKAPNLEQQFLDNAFTQANPDLKPESSWSWELGANVTASDGLRGSVTFYHQWFYDLIRPVPAADGVRQIIKNIGQSNASGLEVEAGWTAPSGVAATAHMSWVRTTIVDNAGLAPDQYPVDSVLPFRPTVAAGAVLDVPLGRLRAIARATVVGSEVVLTARFQGIRTSIDPYALVGLTLNYDAARGLTLYTRGDNLLNTNYLAGYDRRGLPRTWTVGLRATN